MSHIAQLEKATGQDGGTLLNLSSLREHQTFTVSGHGSRCPTEEFLAHVLPVCTVLDSTPA